MYLPCKFHSNISRSSSKSELGSLVQSCRETCKLVHLRQLCMVTWSRKQSAPIFFSQFIEKNGLKCILPENFIVISHVFLSNSTFQVWLKVGEIWLVLTYKTFFRYWDAVIAKTHSMMVEGYSLLERRHCRVLGKENSIEKYMSGRESGDLQYGQICIVLTKTHFFEHSNANISVARCLLVESYS